jgi:hypothetical protein
VTPLLAVVLLAVGAAAGWYGRGRLHVHQREGRFWSEVTTRAMAEAADRQYDRAEAAEGRLRDIRGGT